MAKKSKQVASENGDSLSPAVENKMFAHNENPPRRINKAKINGKDNTLEVEYTFYTADGIIHHSKESSDGQVHKDLLQAFASLVPHMMNIADQKGSPTDPCDNIPETKEYLVTGFVVVPGDEEGVMLIGQKLLSSGKAVNLITPLTKSGDSYGFMDELFESIESCRYESEMYLGGKFAAKQTHMEFPDEVAVAQ